MRLRILAGTVLLIVGLALYAVLVVIVVPRLLPDRTLARHGVLRRRRHCMDLARRAADALDEPGGALPSTSGSLDMMRVALLDDYQQCAMGLADWKSLDPDATVQVFSDHIHELEPLAKRLHTFECVVLMRERTPFPRALFEKLPNLKLLITSGRRNASIDEQAATDHGVQVCGTDLKGMGTAELTWGLIIACLRNIVAEDRALRAGKWQTTLGLDLAGRTLGLLGLGRLGAEVARVGTAFRMKLIAWSPNLTAERAAAAGATLVDQGRADGAVRRAVDPSGAQRPHARPGRQGRSRAHETDRLSHQYLAWADRRRSGAGRDICAST